MKIVKLFEENEEEQLQEQIVFEEYLNESIGKFENTEFQPEHFTYISYLYTFGSYDYILAWDDEMIFKSIYRGKFPKSLR